MRPDPPAIQQLHSIDAPTLVVIGDRDLQYNLDVADTLEDGIPGARRATIRGAGHMSNMEEPEQFNQAVLDFLAEISA